MSTTTYCRHCTVPTISGNVCAFCQDYIPPAPPASFDLGPAVPPPPWAEPGARCETYEGDDGIVASWERHITPDVWVYCLDRVADGRVTRSATRIGHSDLPADGLTGPQALALARALVAAAELATE